MRPNRFLHVALLVLLSALLLPATARADEDAIEEEYEEHARVMRVSLIKGEVSLRRAGQIEWERAKLNVPLVEGDTLATGPDSRLEIQLDARNFIRVAADTVLSVVTLRDEGVAFSLSEGTATFRLARFDREKEYFEVDAPGSTVAAEQQGLYRLDVGRRGDVTVTVRDDGRARIYSQTSGFVLRNNRSARLSTDGSGEGDWDLSAAASLDSWDEWNDDRERYLARRLRHEGRERYYDREVWGAEELDAYGDWVETRDYGYVWRPHVTVINNYYNWAPYRYGHWRYCPPYGWTWIPDEDWGWAPYHYGRWVYVNNYWCWAPRGYGYRYRRAWWRPALVAFVYINTSRGRHLAWYPLGHGQRDPRGRHWAGHRDRLSPLRRHEVDNLRRANPALLRAVTSLPERDFGAERVRARPASVEIARRALEDEPVRGRLPLTPADRARPAVAAPVTGRERVTGAPSARAGGADGRGGLVIARPAPAGPVREVPERPTGAAARRPGVPLDEELRRERVFGGRQPRVSAPPAGGQPDPRASDGNTGAVTRPPRPARRPAEDPGRVEDTGPRDIPRQGGDGASTPTTPRVRPERPNRPSESPVERPDTERPRREERNDAPAPRARPNRPSAESPSSPPVYREPYVRPSAPAERPSAPVERPQPPARRPDPPPAPRTERPSGESRPPARQDPPPRTSAPRQESPRPEAPRPEAPRQQERSSPRSAPRASPRTRDQ